MTPGNFLAEKTWKTSEKHEARTGAEPLFSDCWVFCWGDCWDCWAAERRAEGEPTLTKFILRLVRDVSLGLDMGQGDGIVKCRTTGTVVERSLEESRKVHQMNGERYRNDPSVRTLKSCRMNHTPICPSGLVSLKALTQRLPMRFLVNMPLGVVRESAVGSCCGDNKGPCCICCG